MKLNRILQNDVNDGLDSKWLDKTIFQSIIFSSPGLLELMKTPLMSRLTLEALPYLSNFHSDHHHHEHHHFIIRRAEIYKAFMTKWLKQQEQKERRSRSLRGKFTLTLNSLDGHTKEVTTVVYSENNRYLASSSFDKMAKSVVCSYW